MSVTPVLLVDKNISPALTKMPEPEMDQLKHIKNREGLGSLPIILLTTKPITDPYDNLNLSSGAQVTIAWGS
jgi:hypothetical protein